MVTINEINNLINNNIKKDVQFDTVDSTYLYTTENIKGYFPYVKDKKVLAVTSSGDHYFNSILGEAKEVDLFDINKVALLVLKLKKAAIKTLTYDEFIRFVGLSEFCNYLDYSLFIKVRTALDPDTRNIWEYLYLVNTCDGNRLYYQSNVFICKEEHSSSAVAWNDYLDEDNYYKLQHLLHRLPNETFYHTDVSSLANKLNKKYDYILLSNIQDYVETEKFLEIVKRLTEYLSPNGKMFLAYLYDYSLSMKHTLLNAMVEENLENYSSITLSDSTYNINGDRVIVYTRH